MKAEYTKNDLRVLVGGAVSMFATQMLRLYRENDDFRKNYDRIYDSIEDFSDGWEMRFMLLMLDLSARFTEGYLGGEKT